ncbi:MAG: peptidoglycan-binding domain-containing protein [Pseudomonadales bacterium]
MSAYATQRAAYAAVFNAWGVDFPDADDGTIPCNFAPSAGLQCLSRTGTWSDIRTLNLPVVLELWDSGEAPFYGAVTALSGNLATLHLGARQLQIDLERLRDRWFGRYVVLWQMPPDYHGNLNRGDRHPSVRWLRQQLETLSDRRIPGTAADLFDADLQAAVVTFQRDESLLADGIVGPETWIRLADRLDLPAPQLEP